MMKLKPAKSSPVDLRLYLIVAVVLIFASHRLGPLVNPPVTPVVPVVSDGLLATCRAMQTKDKKALGEMYEILGNAVASDTSREPVLFSTGQIRAANRAGLLFVWRGVLNNPPGKYPTLQEQLETELTASLGMADVPLNPAIRASATKLFSDIAQACK